MSRNIVRFGLAVVFAVLALTLVGTVSAQGPALVLVYPKSGLVVGRDAPDVLLGSPVITRTSAFTVAVGTPPGWSMGDKSEYYPNAELSREEPKAIKDATRAARVAALKIGELTVGDLEKYPEVVQVVARMLGLVPASTPVPASGSAVAAPAVSASVAPVAKTYTVKAGDWLSRIASDNGVSLQALLDANGLTVASVIHPGDVLNIPSGTVATTVAAPAVGQPADITSFRATQGMSIDNVVYDLPVRGDTDVRALAHVETGVALGKNYDIVVPAGWSLGVYGVSFEVAQDGKVPVQYRGNDASVVVRGPWKGKIGAFEAGLHGLPSEWESYLSGQIFSTHKKYVPSAKLTYIP